MEKIKYRPPHVACEADAAVRNRAPISQPTLARRTGIPRKEPSQRNGGARQVSRNGTAGCVSGLIPQDAKTGR